MAAPGAAHGEDREAFVVDLDTEGTAEVSVTYTFVLDSDEERSAFEELQENETAQSGFAERFERRLTTVAEEASEATDREMDVGEAHLSLESQGGVGLVTLTVSWTNLAAVDGDQLVVTEPFASGFEPDRPFTIYAPDEYALTSVTPKPASNSAASANWEADASLEGFELVSEAADDQDAADGTEDNGVGFGAVAALVALLAVTIFAIRNCSAGPRK